MGPCFVKLSLGGSWIAGGSGCNNLLVLWLCSGDLCAIPALSSSGDRGPQGTDFFCTSPWGSTRSSRAAGGISAQWMSTDRLLETVTVQLAGLEITLQARRLAPEVSAAAGTEVAVVASPGVSATEISLPTTAVATTPDPDLDRILAATSARECALLVQGQPALDPWVAKLHASDPVWSPTARIGRAYRAGVLARLRLAGQIPALDSLGVPFRNTYYIVLRGAPGVSACWTNNYSLYLAKVGGRGSSRKPDFDPASISQALPSHAEASAFLVGARQPWPPQAE